MIASLADLEWKLVYVGSAEDEKYDQTLESVLVGPVNMGSFRFVFQVSIPREFSLRYLLRLTVFRKRYVKDHILQKLISGLHFRRC